MKNHAMRFAFALLLPLIFTAGEASAKDVFDSVKCGSDVATVLIGKTLPDGLEVAIEGRHTDIGLKETGGEDVSDRLNSSSWIMCGQEYMLLMNRAEKILDVIAIPPHSRRAPEFSDDVCQRGGTPTTSLVIAILDNSSADPNDTSHYGPGDKTLLPAKAAWQIDQKHGKFVKISTDGLRCPRSGIITLDGGA